MINGRNIFFLFFYDVYIFLVKLKVKKKEKIIKDNYVIDF